jgi:hypothetical protein
LILIVRTFRLNRNPVLGLSSTPGKKCQAFNRADRRPTSPRCFPLTWPDYWAIANLSDKRLWESGMIAMA